MKAAFYQNPRLFALAVLLILAAGLSAYFTIARQEDPTITNLFATVVTPFPGADPARVEALVTEKIEDELEQIAEIDEITSTSRAGISVIQVELSEFITETEIEQTWSEIRDALDDAAMNLPDGVPDPEFDNDRTGAFTAIAALVPERWDGAEAVTRRYALSLQEGLRAQTGTELVRLYGLPEEEILVRIDRRKLASLGLSAEDVSRAIAQADSKVEAGQLRGDTELLIEVEGEIRSLQRIRRVPVAESADGQIVRVADVAEVIKQVKTPPESVAFAGGERAILIAPRMETGRRVDLWAANLRKKLDEFRAELPAGLSLELLFDQSEYTQERLAAVAQNLLIGVALVVGVLLITLGWRAAIVVAAVLPLASLIALPVLNALGIPIHQMSVTGLVVSLGLLVDAAIVMTDAIGRRLRAGVARLQAVRESVDRLAAPLLSSTITTALAFMPMALLPGPAGDFVGSIAIAVIVMLLSSLALALTLTPAMAGWLLAGGGPNKAARTSLLGRAFGGSLALALRHPRLSIMAALILPVIGFGAFPTLKAQFFPGVDRDQLYIQVKLPSGTSIDSTAALARETGETVRAKDEIMAVQWVVGESAPAFYYNMITDQDQTPSFAEALVTTRSPEATERLLPDLQRELDRAYPEARIVVRGLVQGPPVNAPVELRLVGPNLETLRALGDELRLIMSQEPEIKQARTQLEPGELKLIVNLSEEKVRLAGLDFKAVARQLSATLDGATGGSLIEGTEELPVRVRTGEDVRERASALRTLDITGPGARQAALQGDYPGIPLTALGEVEVVPAQTPIYRRNGERINTVQGFVQREVLPEEALQKVLASVEQSDFELPHGYRLEVGGDSDARNETLSNLLAQLGVIVALTIAAIVLTFNSFRLTGITLMVAGLSIGLSLLALAAFQYPFGIQAVIGVIGSIGVSINAAIIILTALQQSPAAMAGDLAEIRDIVQAQSRHIMSTTITTFGGFLPLILEGGGFWPPFAMAIAGGVLLSSVVSFYFTPPMFVLLRRKSSSEPQATRQAGQLAEAR